MTNKESVIFKIFRYFKDDENLHVGRIIPPSIFRSTNILTHEEKSVYHDVIEELLEDGLFEYKENDFSKSPLGTISAPSITEKGIKAVMNS